MRDRRRGYRHRDRNGEMRRLKKEFHGSYTVIVVSTLMHLSISIISLLAMRTYVDMTSPSNTK